MTIEEAIQHANEKAEELSCVSEKAEIQGCDREALRCAKCAADHRQLAEWLKELRVFKSRKGRWIRMSALSEQKDDRYKCSHCGNVIHHKNKMDLYTFNSWCGRCGSDNGIN